MHERDKSNRANTNTLLTESRVRVAVSEGRERSSPPTEAAEVAALFAPHYGLSPGSREFLALERDLGLLLANRPVAASPDDDGDLPVPEAVANYGKGDDDFVVPEKVKSYGGKKAAAV